MIIKDLIGKPYVNKGRGDGGYDCFGLVLEVLKRFGYEVGDVDYEKSNELTFSMNYKKVIDTLQGFTEQKGQPKESDVIIFFDDKGRGVHCGVMLSRNTFIHCDKFGVNVARLETFYRRYWRIYKWQW